MVELLFGEGAVAENLINKYSFSLQMEVCGDFSAFGYEKRLAGLVHRYNNQRSWASNEVRFGYFKNVGHACIFSFPQEGAGKNVSKKTFSSISEDFVFNRL